MKPLSFFATVLAASGLCAVANAQTAAPVVFSLAVAGLSRDQVEVSVQAKARVACRAAYRGLDLTTEYDFAGYQLCVQNTVAEALAQAAPALAAGAPIRFVIRPQPEERP